MPQTWKSSSPALAIELAAPPKCTFAAGDMITGTVCRSAHLVTPEATVTLRLLGRAKTKIEIPRGTYRRDVYRGRFNFFTSIPPEATQRIVFHGPIHIPEGAAAGDSHSWPFSVVVPSGPWVTPEPAGQVQDSSFLPLTVEDIPRHALPGTFRSSDIAFSTGSECFVEYYLEACLQFSRGKSVEMMTALQPVTLRHQSTTYPITDFQLQSHEWDKCVRSYLLVPGHETGRLSFKQKSQKLFGSSKVPQFQFKVCVAVPGVLQLDNPTPIPIQLLAIPTDDPSTVSKGGSPPIVKLNHIRVSLKSETVILAPGSWSGVHEDRHSVGRFLGLEDAFEKLPEPVTIPYGDKPVDVGTLLNLRISAEGLYSHNKRLCPTPVIIPGFTTYNIRHTNFLNWVISYTVAGEKQKIEFKSDVIILAPAESRQAPVGPSSPLPPQLSPPLSPPTFQPNPNPEQKETNIENQ